jgi:hypothetical protein
MLHSEPEEYANWKTVKFASAAAEMALLAGCAVAVPLRPLATYSQSTSNGDFACTANPRCPNGSTDRRVAYRRSQPDTAKFDDGPPDFILNSQDQAGTRR